MQQNCSNETEVFPAHIREDGCIQTVSVHCRETAQIASESLASIGFSALASLSGLLHDAGKMTMQFREYITDASMGKPVQKGSIPHSFAGVQYLFNAFHGNEETFSYADITCELAAYAVGAHHGQFDVVDNNGCSGFEHRLMRNDIHYNEAIGAFLSQCVNEQEIKTLFESAIHEVANCVPNIVALTNSDDSRKANQEIIFYLGLLARLLQSAVIEGDRCSTASFMDPSMDNRLSVCPSAGIIWQTALESVEHDIAQRSIDSLINKARHHISELCADFSAQPSGIYRLNVPTGGGKTLSGVRFALAHAQKWSKSHVFYIAPLISILEQNAEVIRKAAGCSEWILEHHSNVIRDDANENELRRTELFEESWNAPIIVTTLVQFLNTLFSGKTSSVRRFHALANSVIIIDEVQTVPAHMLSLFNLAMNFLSAVCSSTIILCSATQPCLEETNHPMRINSMMPVPYSAELWQAFSRTKIIDAGAMRLEQIPHMVQNAMIHTRSILLVCNKKGEAEELFHSLKRRSLARRNATLPK